MSKMIDLNLVNESAIARQIGVTQAAVYFYLSGQRRNDKNIAKIADLLHTDVGTLKEAIAKRKEMLRLRAVATQPPAKSGLIARPSQRGIHPRKIVRSNRAVTNEHHKPSSKKGR